MASVEQVIKALLKRIEELEARVAALEAGATAPDEWNAEIDIDLGDDDDLTPGELDQVKAARKRLKEDTGGVIEEEPAQVSLDVGAGGVTAWFPVATDEQIEQRRAMMEQVQLEELDGIEMDDAEYGWIQGGPLWLHAYDRDHVLSLPLPVRQGLILDAMLSSQKDALDLSRDILKDESPGTPDVAYDNLLNQMSD